MRPNKKTIRTEQATSTSYARAPHSRHNMWMNKFLRPAASPKSTISETSHQRLLVTIIVNSVNVFINRLSVRRENTAMYVVSTVIVITSSLPSSLPSLHNTNIDNQPTNQRPTDRPTTANHRLPQTITTITMQRQGRSRRVHIRGVIALRRPRKQVISCVSSTEGREEVSWWPLPRGKRCNVATALLSLSSLLCCSVVVVVAAAAAVVGKLINPPSHEAPYRNNEVALWSVVRGRESMYTAWRGVAWRDGTGWDGMGWDVFEVVWTVDDSMHPQVRGTVIPCWRTNFAGDDRVSVAGPRQFVVRPRSRTKNKRT